MALKVGEKACPLCPSHTRKAPSFAWRVICPCLIKHGLLSLHLKQLTTPVAIFECCKSIRKYCLWTKNTRVTLINQIWNSTSMIICRPNCVGSILYSLVLVCEHKFLMLSNMKWTTGVVLIILFQPGTYEVFASVAFYRRDQTWNLISLHMTGILKWHC